MNIDEACQAIYRHEFPVPDHAIDGNGHVNNVAYVQWMQDIAVMHSDAVGCSDATRGAGCTWFARQHTIEYLNPAYAGDTIVLSTWVADFRRVRSLRHYHFHRASDQTLLARGTTDWVYVDARSGRPCSIPDELRNLFQVVDAD